MAFRQRAAGGLQPFLGNRFLRRHAAAVGYFQLGEIELVEPWRVQQAVVERVDGRKKADLVLLQFLDEARHVARVGDQQVGAAGTESQEVVRGQREDEIERRRAD